jgi:hypothetical protein
VLSVDCFSRLIFGLFNQTLYLSLVDIGICLPSPLSNVDNRLSTFLQQPLASSFSILDFIFRHNFRQPALPHAFISRFYLTLLIINLSPDDLMIIPITASTTFVSIYFHSLSLSACRKKSIVDDKEGAITSRNLLHHASERYCHYDLLSRLQRACETILPAAQLSYLNLLYGKKHVKVVEGKHEVWGSRKTAIAQTSEDRQAAQIVSGCFSGSFHSILKHSYTRFAPLLLLLVRLSALSMTAASLNQPC